MENFLEKIGKSVNVDEKTCVIISNKRYITNFFIENGKCTTRFSEHIMQVILDILSSEIYQMRLAQIANFSEERQFICTKYEILEINAKKVNGLKRNFIEYSSG